MSSFFCFFLVIAKCVVILFRAFAGFYTTVGIRQQGLINPPYKTACSELEMVLETE